MLGFTDWLIPGLNDKPLTISLVENEAVDIHISNNASKFKQAGTPQTIVKVSGMRWAGNGFFNFHWGAYELSVNEAVSVKLVEDTRPATPVRHEEKYVEPEKQCSFCYRKASQVPHLIEGNLFACICSECITECQRLVESRNGGIHRGLAMPTVKGPRLHDAWRKTAADREEDAASLFGYYLIKHCREAALAKLKPATVVSRSDAVDAVDTALHNMMDLLEGFWRLDAGGGKQLELALHIVVTEEGRTAEDVQVSPSQIDLPIGYWAWVEDYGSTLPEGR